MKSIPRCFTIEIERFYLTCRLAIKPLSTSLRGSQKRITCNLCYLTISLNKNNLCFKFVTPIWMVQAKQILQYTFIENDLVGIVASTPVPPRAKSSELQLASLISAYTEIYDFKIDLRWGDIQYINYLKWRIRITEAYCARRYLSHKL